MHSSEVIMVSEEAVVSSIGKCTTIKLTHPRSKQPVLFIWNKKMGKLYELQRVHELHRSWLLGSHVKSDGSLYLCTPCDPLFFLLFAASGNQQFTTLTALFSEDTNLATILSARPDVEDRLSLICDVKTLGDQTLYRYSKDKALNWLSTRVSHQVRSVASSITPSMTDAAAPDYAADSKQAEALMINQLTDDECQRFAFQLISDYLDPELASELAERMGISTHPVNGDSKSNLENLNPLSSTGKSDSAQPTEDYSNSLSKFGSSKGAESQGPKKRKTIKGVQSITNFFCKGSA
ncbi:unnamed protein product [Dicrocoelium dendriticum]|nr:unnamed protein product [Dicrocoelium dendriticum]